MVYADFQKCSDLRLFAGHWVSTSAPIAGLHDYLVLHFPSFLQAHKKLVEKRNQEMAERSKEHAEKLRAERLKKLENYEEPEWMKMENLEGSLKEIEANLDQTHGCEAGRD